MLTRIFAIITLSSSALLANASGTILDALRQQLETTTTYSVSYADLVPEPFRVTLVGRRSEDSAEMSVYLQRIASQASAERWSIYAGPSSGDAARVPYSGLPLGHATFATDNAAQMRIHSRAGLYSIDLRVNYRGSRTGPGQTNYHAADRQADRKAAEGITRAALAAANGKDATPASAAIVNGTSVPAITAVGGSKLVDFDRYLQARGIQASFNTVVGTASFSHNGKLVIVPLASFKIKHGSDWIKSADIVSLRDGAWFVPLSAMTAVFGS